jgi:hypothetical protein
MYQVMWGVLKNSPHRDEAVKFLLAMNKPRWPKHGARQPNAQPHKRELSRYSFGKIISKTFRTMCKQLTKITVPIFGKKCVDIKQ